MSMNENEDALMTCRCDPTRGQSCGRCDGSEPRIETVMDVRDHGDEHSAERFESRYDAMVYGSAA